jgi:hypothetical protein
MSRRVRRFLTGMLLGLALVSPFMIGTIASAHTVWHGERLHYYGSDLEAVERATGVHPDGSVDANGPWPQRTQNYCFVAVVQALVNYQDIMQGEPLRYPHQSDQGPASGNPNDERAGQILWDMDHLMVPPDGPLVAKGSGIHRRPFTLGNIAYDFGGDPRIQAFATDYEAHADEMDNDGQHAQGHFDDEMLYHEHIYHTDAATATWGLVKALVRFRKPVLVLANHAEHTLLVAGLWATSNPLTDPDAKVRSLAVFNPWNSAAWGQYITTGPYQQVPLDDWLHATNLPTPFGGVTTMLNLPYASNGGLDPDPSIGIYQVGPGTKHPNAQHWIGNFVLIEPDTHWQSANFSFDEDNRLMLQP